MQIGLDMTEGVGIFETNPSGHRLHYVKLLVEHAAAIHEHKPVLFASESVVQSREYDVHLGALRDEFSTVVVPGGGRLRDVQKMSLHRDISLLIVPDGNVWAMEALCTPFSGGKLETRLLIMRDPKWELLERPWRLRSLAKVLAFSALDVVGGVSLFWLREPGNPEIRPFDVIDPIVLDGQPETVLRDSFALRRTLGMADDTFWFGMTGVLSDAKLSRPVLEALSDVAATSHRRVRLALIGPVSAGATWPQSVELFPILEDALVVDRYLSNYEVGVAIGAFDCLIATYVAVHGPSATLAKAAALGIRTVSGGPPSLRRFATNITGFSSVEVTRDALVVRLREALEQNRPEARHQVGSSQFAQTLLT